MLRCFLVTRTRQARDAGAGCYALKWIASAGVNCTKGSMAMDVGERCWQVAARSLRASAARDAACRERAGLPSSLSHLGLVRAFFTNLRREKHA